MNAEKWRQVADVLAAAMQHNERGVCTLTENEHAALKVYIDARRPGRMIARSYLGLTGGLDAFRHDDHAPSPEFVVSRSRHRACIAGYCAAGDDAVCPQAAPPG